MKRIIVAALFLCSGTPAWMWAWSVLPHNPLSFAFTSVFHDIGRHAGSPEARAIEIPIAVYAWSFSIVWLLWFIWNIWIHRAQCSASQSRLDAAGFITPELGVPHTRCVLACNGDTIVGVHVTLRNAFIAHDSAFLFSFAFAGLLGGLFSSQVIDNLSAATVSVLVSAVVVAFGYLLMLSDHNTVEITSGAVIVNGRSYYRGVDGFKAFAPMLPGSGKYEAYQVTLQFTYGHARYRLPGAWLQGQAEEIASALNHYLNRVPVGAQGSQPNPGNLRGARPITF